MRLIIITLITLLALPLSAMADDVAAVSAAAKGRYSVAPSTQTGKDLITWYRLQKSENAGFQDAALFLSKHHDWPGLGEIRIKAERAITPSVPSTQIIRFFGENPPVTAQGMQHYLKALIASGQTAQAMQTLKNWWPKALLAPNDQDMMIDQFGKYLGSQDHERRLRYIIYDQHYTASRRLARELGYGYPELVEAKIALIEEKPNVNELVARVPASLRNNEALMLARIQWRRKNGHDEGAIDLLNKAPSYNRLSNPEAWWQERHIMARRLMEQKKWGSAYNLVKDHRQKDGFSFAQAEFLAGWLALRKIGKPWEGFQHFERLFNAVESPISRSRGSYWAGLAAETLGHTEIAGQWYRVAAKYQTTYYGQMAAGRINLPLGLLQETPIQVSYEQRAAFRNRPMIREALLLHRIGQHRDARAFLLAYVERYKTGLDYSLAAELAKQIGYSDTAVRIAKSAERDGYIMPSYLFPIVDKALSASFAIHPAFNHGIMRQESAFDQMAQSHAGALGLMQLMPATAEETARKAGLGYSKVRLTSDPVYNITLGSLYIKQMLDQFDGNRTLAIAAYNAGPGRVRGWLKTIGDPRTSEIDEVDWVESIPIYETRNYVQRVTEAINVYAHRLK